MSTSATKIALGVGCGIFAALALALVVFAGSCVAIGGTAITGVGNALVEAEREKQEALAALEIHTMSSERKGGSDGWLEVAGSVRNDGVEPVGLFEVECDLLDGTDTVVDTGSDHILGQVQPGESARWDVSFFNAPPGVDKYRCGPKP